MNLLIRFDSMFASAGLTLIDHNCRHVTYIRWSLRTCCARMTESRSFLKKKIGFLTILSIHPNALIRSNNIDSSLRASISEIPSNISTLIVGMANSCLPSLQTCRYSAPGHQMVLPGTAGKMSSSYQVKLCHIGL